MFLPERLHPIGFSMECELFCLPPYPTMRLLGRMGTRQWSVVRDHISSPVPKCAGPGALESYPGLCLVGGLDFF